MGTIIPQQDTEKLVSCILDMGELLLTSGAEVMRVEDTIRRLCHAYGFTRADIFTITSSIVLTVHREDGRIFTQTRRIQGRDTNLARVEQVNCLSRAICEHPVTEAEFGRRVAELRENKTDPGHLVSFFVYGGLSACFAVFFGGDGADALAAFLSGLAMYLFLQGSRSIHLNDFIQSVLVSGLTALVVSLLLALGIGHNADKITIGNIMLLIPGIAFTTALRDIINGDTISGLLGVCEAVIKAVAIAAGFALVLVGIGG